MEIMHRKTVSSTNDWAKEHASTGGSLPMAFLADEQTSGRGTRGKIWESPAGWTFVSVAFPPPKKNAAELSLKTAEVVCDILRGRCRESLGGHSRPTDSLKKECDYSPTDLWVKPPNDVYYGDKKVSGTLLEQTKDVLAIGIGIDYPPDDLAQIVADRMEVLYLEWSELEAP
jgi:BirA family biotin operon repressor/biotin-[acetyl-CoA-carboxylase] ligase